MSGALEDVVARLKAYQAQMQMYKPKVDELEGYHQVSQNIYQFQVVGSHVHCTVDFSPMLLKVWLESYDGTYDFPLTLDLCYVESIIVQSDIGETRCVLV